MGSVGLLLLERGLESLDLQPGSTGVILDVLKGAHKIVELVLVVAFEMVAAGKLGRLLR